MNKHGQLEREKLLFRYSSALQRGDFAAVEAVLLEAQHDPALDDLIADLNAAYETELNAAHTILSNNRRYREDQAVNITLDRNVNPLPNRKRIPFTLAAAVLAVALMSAVLLTLRGGGMRPSNLAAVEQSLSPTASNTALISPSPTMISAAQIAVVTVTLPGANANVCTTHARVNNQTFAHVRPSDSSTLSGQIPTGTIVEIWAMGLPAPDDKTVSPIWTFIKADVNGSSVQGWIDLNGATQLDCPTSSSAGAVPAATLPPTPIVLDSSIATPAALCRVEVTSAVDVYSRPFPYEGGVVLGQLPANSVVDVLDQEYRPTNSFIWYFVSTIANSTPIQGWIRSDQTSPIFVCPQPANVPQPALANRDNILLTATAIVNEATASAPAVASAPIDGFMLTATAIVDEATALAAPGAAYPLSTPVPAVVMLEPTVCPPTPIATPTLIDAVPSSAIDEISLTATAFVAQATVLAQPPCFAFDATPVPADIAILSSGQGVTGVVSSLEWVYIRQAPDVSSSPVLTVAPGTVVFVVAQSDDGRWLNIRMENGYSGWIATNLVNLNVGSSVMSLEPTVIPTVCPPDQVMNITSHLLEILSSPSRGSITIGTLTPGTVATVHGSEVDSGNQTWLLITIEVTGSSVTGWVPALEVASVPCAAVEVAPSVTLDCAVFSSSERIIQVRNEPSESAMSIGALPSGLVANVRDQKQSDEGYTWYFVTVRLDSAVVTGWIREDYTITVEPCPVFPTDIPTEVAPVFAPAASFTPTAVSP